MILITVCPTQGVIVRCFLCCFLFHTALLKDVSYDFFSLIKLYCKMFL